MRPDHTPLLSGSSEGGGSAGRGGRAGVRRGEVQGTHRHRRIQRMWPQKRCCRCLLSRRHGMSVLLPAVVPSGEEHTELPDREAVVVGCGRRRRVQADVAAKRSRRHSMQCLLPSVLR